MSKRTAILLALVVVVAVSFVAARRFNAKEPRFSASGALEARNVNIGSKVGGRVTQVLAAEGDTVEAGQLLLVFDDAETSARVAQARGRLAQARATLAKLQHGSRPEEIAEAQAAGAGTANAPGARAEEIAQVRADLERAKADSVRAGRDFQRAQELSAEGVVSRQFRDDAEARAKMADAQVRAAEHAVSAAQGRLRAATAVQRKTERGSRSEDVDFARADVARAEGELQEAEARWAEREVRAPARSVIEVMDVRPGDLIPANSRVAKLLEAEQLFVMVFVPQSQVGKIKVGQNARVRVDAFSAETFQATVEQIRQQAEFLPRNVQTREERVHQVIGVKLRVQNKEGRLRPGINADVDFDEVK